MYFADDEPNAIFHLAALFFFAFWPLFQRYKTRRQRIRLVSSRTAFDVTLSAAQLA
jgi:hypothetical protein